eukprot:TCALIF_03763-PA protein Name:"Protein of unknown function" AED:0.53 eAED:0.55 QI:99/0.75/0.6/1/0.5/0.8/5/0/272
MMVALFSWALAVLSLVPCQAYPDFDNQYCLTPWNSVHFSYSAAAGPENEVYPETCWNRCLAQKPDLQVIAFTKTRTDELICFCPNTPAVTCNSVNGCPHPVELKVNFGDGSGDLIYNYELGETINVWTHMYTYPGEFMTVVIVKNILTGKLESSYHTFTVYEDIVNPPAIPQDVELSCPHLMRPGQYFQCTVFLRIGTNLKINLKMMDDITGRVDVNTNALRVPNYWFDIPGQVFPLQAYNDSTQVTSGASFFYAFPSTAFNALVNVSKIEI